MCLEVYKQIGCLERFDAVVLGTGWMDWFFLNYPIANGDISATARNTHLKSIEVMMKHVFHELTINPTLNNHRHSD